MSTCLRFTKKVSILVDRFSIYNPIDNLLFKTKIECIKFVTEKFMHLDKIAENIFACNAPNSTFKGLFLYIKPLERLLNSEGTIG